MIRSQSESQITNIAKETLRSWWRSDGVEHLSSVSKLIESLEAQHSVILNVLQDVLTLGLTTEEGRTTLLKGKDAVLSHLALEDRELYPPLLDSTRDVTVAREFAEEMRNLSSSVVEFFEKVEQRDPEAVNLFPEVVALLTSRISREEQFLYPAYTNLAIKAAGKADDSVEVRPHR